jgi:hypothetical protein
MSTGIALTREKAVTFKEKKIITKSEVTESEVFYCHKIVHIKVPYPWQKISNKSCRPITFKMSDIRSHKTLERVLTEY